MGLSKKTHKKADQETQSPMIKVFKEIKQLTENANNPEKANLLKEKREKKKKRFSSKPKCTDYVNVQKSGDTSTSDKQYKVMQHHQTKSYSHPKSQSIFQSEKRDSWWVWGGNEKKNQEDTCSCVSCALKKIVTSQRSGLFLCIAAVLALSGVVALCIVLETMPKAVEDASKIELSKTYDDDRNRGGRERRSEFDVNQKGTEDREIWDESKARLLNSLSELDAAEFGESGLHDPSLLEGSRRPLMELASILDPNKIAEGYSSNTLRNFYKKLIKTDMQIKKLKKSIQDTTTNVYDYSDFNMRPKRSLKFMSRSKETKKQQLHQQQTTLKSVARQGDESFKKYNIFYPPAASTTAFPRVKKSEKEKRQVEGPALILVEKNRLTVEYKPNARRRKVAQCSHTPKESKSHENELKHPFYKNSERLDEILDRLIEKNVPDLVLDDIHVVNANKQRLKQKDSRKKDFVLETDEIYNFKPDQEKTKITRADTNPMVGKLFEIKNTTPRSGGVLTVATILTPIKSNPDYLIEQVPHLRKLLQVENDEESGDTELRETDEGKTKRKETDTNIMKAGTKYPFSVNNPNWKGPMPLYPDELNSIIKQAAMQNMNKVEIPVSKDNVGDNNIDLSDTEYVEDYANNKYDKLVKMAQAYSDYGVLEDKKQMKNENKARALENRVKLSVQKGLTMLGRLKKNKDTQMDSEGIRFELKPKGAVVSENMDGDFFKLGSHLKIAHENKEANDFHRFLATSTLGSDSALNTQNFEFIFTPEPKQKSLAIPKGHRSSNEDDSLLGSRHKRSLKSVENDDIKPNDVENGDTTEHGAIYAEYTTTDIINERPTNNIAPSNLKLDVAENITEVNTNKTLIKKEITRDQNFYDIDASKNLTNAAANLNKEIVVNASQDNVILNNSFTGPSEILGLISDWFLILNALENDKEHENDTGFFLDTLALLNPGFEQIPITPTVLKTTTSNPIYPMIDSEMFDNIAHRSRVLMSVEEKPENVTAAADQDDNKVKNSKPTEDIDKLTNATSTQIVNITNTNKENLTITPEPKTIVKRSAAENNLIFWNDMYDDEYGIKDPLENAVREKNSVKYNDILAKSENWLGVKLRKISDSVRNSKLGKITTKQTTDKGNKINKVSKRSDNIENSFADDKQSFSDLMPNIKKICREAAEAVHQTKHMAVRSENDPASSLMGQLVSLMSDLVEIQVQQKTCVPLPPDLRTFLIWLTNPIPDESNPQMQQFDEVNSESYSTETLEDKTMAPVMYPSDVRTECLGTIHDVQHLIELYDEMSEEDKSKMSGVREYLENQLEFLHKQLSTFEGYNVNYPKIQEQPMRRRRHVHNEKTTRKYKQIKRPRRIRKVQKFIKSFGKKRTRSTGNYDESLLEGFTVSMETKAKNENEVTSQNDGVSYVKRNDEMKDGNLNEMKYIPGTDERKDMNANDEMRDVNERDKLRDSKKKDAQKRNLPVFHRVLNGVRNVTSKNIVVSN